MVVWCGIFNTQQQHCFKGNQVKIADHHKSLGHLVSQKPESAKIYKVSQVGKKTQCCHSPLRLRMLDTLPKYLFSGSPVCPTEFMPLN
jgi:hypothetical protein